MRICGWLRRRFAGYTIAVTSGDAQTQTVGQALGSAITVTVRANGTGSVVSGATVHWVESSGDGVVTASSQTNGSGVASATWTLGTGAGTQRVTATVAGGGSVRFSATATADTAAAIHANSVEDQSKGTSSAVDTPPSVLVTDQYGNPKSGVSVTWAVASGGGTVDDTGGTSTGSDGVATVTSWTLGGSVGANSVTATVAGLTGSPVTFRANATAATPDNLATISGTGQTGVVAGAAAAAFGVRVRDSGNAGIPGVTVAWDVLAGGGSLSASTSVTDSNGDAFTTLTTGTTVGVNKVRASVNAGNLNTGTDAYDLTTVAGTVTRLAIVTQPAASGQSGVALTQQPAVEATDVNGNRNTSYTGTVTASVASGNAQITAGSTKAAVSGLATFTALTLNDTDSGDNFIQFSASGLTSVTSQAVVLAPPLPDRLGVGTQPSTVNTNTAISPAPTFLIQDSSGVTVPGATNSVTVALGDNGEGAVLSGTLTVAAVNGVATFNGLSVDVAGSYTLDATASGLTGVSSSAFTVNTPSTTWTHEPAGMTLVTNHPFDTAILGTNWTGETGYGNSWTISTDATAPRSPSAVARLNIPNNKTGGTGFPNVTPPDFRTRNHSRIFVAFTFKLGSNFVGGGSGVQKLLHIWGSTTGTSFGNILIPGVFWSAAANRWLWNAAYQGFPSTNDAGISVQNTFGNVVLDTWYEVEIDVTFNTGAAIEDGTYSMYVRAPSTGVTYQKLLTGLHMSNASARKWYYLDIDPTYMSTGFNAPNAMQMYFDDFYVSTKA